MALQSLQIYLDTVRECYEAFVIYSFFMYLLAYLEDEYGDISVYLSTKEEVAHMWGLQWVLKPWRMGDEFMWQCKKVRPGATATIRALLLIGRPCSSTDELMHCIITQRSDCAGHCTGRFEYISSAITYRLAAWGQMAMCKACSISRTAALYTIMKSYNFTCRECWAM